MKKLISIILCLTLVLGLAIFASAAEEPATLSFADDANRTMQDDNQQIWEANGVKLINAIGASTNPIKDYFNPIRLYAKTNVTIEYPNMTSIVLVCPTQAYAEVWEANNADANATVSIAAEAGTSNYLVTISFAAPTNSYSVTELTKQTRVASLTVYTGNQAPDTPDVPNVPEQPAEPELGSIAAAVAGKDGNNFKVQGVVTCIDGKNVYIMDETGGICVRGTANVEGLAIGDSIVAVGSKSVYNGLPQLNGSYEKVDGAELEINETTIDSLTLADLCTYVKLTGLTVTDIFDNDGAYTTPNVTVTDGTNTIQIYKAVVGKNDDGSWAIAVGDKINVCAAVSCYKETLQLRNTSADEITAYVEPVEPPVDDPIDPPSDDPEDPIPGTGDLGLGAVVVALIAATAGAIVIGKKKEF